MGEQEQTILDTQVKGITARLLWQAFAGWTSLVVVLLGIYFSLKSQIKDSTLEQSRIDAIQDLRLDGMKRDIELQNLQIKDLDERYNELKSQK
jgi:hypothetical protein